MKVKQIRKSKFRKKVSLLFLISILGLTSVSCNHNNIEDYKDEIIITDEDLLEIDLSGDTDVETLFDIITKEDLTNVDIKINGFFDSSRLETLINKIKDNGINARSIEFTVYSYNEELMNSLSSINSQSITINCYLDHNLENLDITSKLNDATKRLEIIFSSIVDVNNVIVNNINVISNNELINVCINGGFDATIDVPEDVISSAQENIIFIIENPIVKTLK